MESNVPYKFKYDEAIAEYAKNVLNETEETRKICLDEIKNWLNENPHLNARNEDKYIIPFLRVSKYNLEKAKIKIKNFYCLRRDRPEWFRNRNPLSEEIRTLAKMGCFLPLLKTHENQLVFIIRTACHDPKVHHIDDVLKAGKMIADIALQEEELGHIYGVIAILDLTGTSYRHAVQLTPYRIGRMVHTWQNYHCRPQKLAFVNGPSFFNVFVNLFKSFMSEKLRARVQVCTAADESFHAIVDKDILPKEYGGTSGTIEELGDYWYQKLVQYADWFAQDEKYHAK